MATIQWARASQFNWAFDNMGGTPLQEVVAGNWSGASALVQNDGRVSIAAPNPGGGQVFFVRGVWASSTTFLWDGFWAEPLSGDLTNYYVGGSFSNQGAATIITLGTSLPPGTPVQLYYIYLTGERAAKYEALSTYPCIRRAYRARDDYNYDFPVDRLLDLMVFLYFAGREQGRDYAPMSRFLWEAFFPRQASLTPPLVHDTFERQLWDRGAYLLYRGTSVGLEGFKVFQIDQAEGLAGRGLHVQTDLPATPDAAWFGYGLNWVLEKNPFNAIDRVQFTLQGQAGTLRLHNLTKIGSGNATLVLKGDYLNQEKRRFVVQIETAGEVGAATFRWSRDGGLTWEASGLVSGDAQHPVPLSDGLEVYWESGAGTDLMAGDYWTFWGGEPAVHPRRLLLVLNDSHPQAPDPWGPQHTYVHALPDRFPELRQFEVPFSQFWRRDNIIDDGDRVRAMWGAWYATTQPDADDITVGDREETEVLFGDTFYTQTQVTWDLSPYVTAFGVWAGIDPQRCDSTGHTNLNFLIKPVVSGANSLTIRIKAKDAQGSYFYQDETVAVNAWQRMTINLGDMLLESGAPPLTHPLQAVDIGIPASPPSNGAFYITDLKFDAHLTFAGAQRLRVLEFRIEQAGLAEHEWWLDEVGLNLEAQDPYPYAPRLAISLTPYGQSPWRGPTLVHYVQPLAPYLVGALDLAQNYLNLHRDAQEEFHRRYGGVKGPILPVHTRNDVENIALCGEENFGSFCWWPRFRDYGKVVGFWPFNEALTDASGKDHDLTLNGGGEAAYTTGICQPGPTAVSLDGSHYLSHADNPDLNMGAGDFTVEVLFKTGVAGAMTLLAKYAAGRGYSLGLTPSSQLTATVGDGTHTAAVTGDRALNDGAYHLLTLSFAANQADGLKLYVDGVREGPAASTADLGDISNTASLAVGADSAGENMATGAVDLVRLHQGRALGAAEIAGLWSIMQGSQGGSAYPEAGAAPGQYWAFMRLAQYYYVTNDGAAAEILGHWLTWIDTYGAADGAGWKFPQNFSEFGFTYGSYDPGATAALALGCLYIYLRNGHPAAATWPRRILDDLRQNRQDQEFGGYKSDYHHGWLNALVIQSFGLAVHGRAGQAFAFAATDEDRSHLEGLLAWAFSHSGDVKPNLLNAELIPFSYSEAADAWDLAPHYLCMRQMGSLEGVVSMAGAALEYARTGGDWTWFKRLLTFILTDDLVVLAASHIRSLTLAYDQAGLKNLVRVRYADYDRDDRKYAEARQAEAISAWGEQAVDLDFCYGGPVILENPETAQLLASRLLKRLVTPWEVAQVETWLEGLRIELGDTVAVSSDFHGFTQAEFTVFGKDVDLGRRAVSLSLTRPFDCSWYFAVDSPDTDFDAYAIDQNSPYDANWTGRAYAG
jgi:hypothetical protein